MTSQIIRKKEICSYPENIHAIKFIPLHSCGKNGFSLKNLFFFVISDPSDVYLDNKRIFSLHVFYQANENMFFESPV